MVKGGVLGGSRSIIPVIAKSLPRGKGRIGVHKEDVTLGKPKVRYEVLKGGSRKCELPERKRAKLVSLSKIDTGSEEGIFNNVGVKKEGTELPPDARGNDEEGIEGARGARTGSLPDSSARKGREALGGEIEEGEGRKGPAGSPE
jgi:hypothetical protein